MSWLPINSAPKDGTKILVLEEDFSVSWVSWDKEEIYYPGHKPIWTWCVPGSHQDEQGGCQTVDNPIGWMPVPTADKDIIKKLKEQS